MDNDPMPITPRSATPLRPITNLPSASCQPTTPKSHNAHSRPHRHTTPPTSPPSSSTTTHPPTHATFDALSPLSAARSSSKHHHHPHHTHHHPPPHNFSFLSASPSIIRAVRAPLLCGFEFASRRDDNPAAAPDHARTHHHPHTEDDSEPAHPARTPDRAPEAAYQVVGHCAGGSWSGEHVRFGILGQEVVRVVPANMVSVKNGPRGGVVCGDMGGGGEGSCGEVGSGGASVSLAEFLAAQSEEGEGGQEFERRVNTRLFHGPLDEEDENDFAVAGEGPCFSLVKSMTSPQEWREVHDDMASEMTEPHDALPVSWCGQHTFFDDSDDDESPPHHVPSRTSTDSRRTSPSPAVSSYQGSSGGSENSFVRHLDGAMQAMAIQPRRARLAKSNSVREAKLGPECTAGVAKRIRSDPGLDVSKARGVSAKRFVWGLDK